MSKADIQCCPGANILRKADKMKYGRILRKMPFQNRIQLCCQRPIAYNYFQGISRTAQVRQLCIQDTGVLLLEMPFSGWSSRTVEDLAALAQQQEMTVVLAHVERYLPDQPRALWPKLRRMGILFQCNASFFLDWRTKHRAVKMLRNREIDILGSDCHGVSYRPPRLDEAAKFICRHAGNEALSRLEDCSRKLIGTDR